MAAIRVAMRTDDLSDPPPPPSSGDLPIQSRDLPSSSASPRSVSRDSPWSKSPENVSVEVIGAVDGVVSLEIPPEILSDPNPLWKCYVVGYS